MPEWLNAVIAALSGLFGAGLTAFIAWQKLKQDRPTIEAVAEKTDAEAQATISKTWNEIYNIAKADLASARLENSALKGITSQLEAELEKRDLQREKDLRLIRAFKKQTAALSAQLVDCGMLPYKIELDEFNGATQEVHQLINTATTQAEARQEEAKKNETIDRLPPGAGSS